MKILSEILTITRNFDESKFRLFNHIIQRGFKFESKLKWVRPEKVSVWDPSHTGDLSSFDFPSENAVTLQFQNSKELETADDSVKKVFSISYQSNWHSLLLYQEKLVDSVRRHKYDDSSPEVIIAKMTAVIRYYQPILNQLPVKRHLVSKVNVTIDRRRKKLTQLRKEDYRRFEWLLEKLNLVYKPYLNYEAKITRKSSLRTIAKLQMEQAKEAKLAEYREALDKEKIPFLENKLAKLKWIMEMEEKHNFPQTVTEKDIQECEEKIEKTKIKIAENRKYGYKLKVHPFTLEKYNEARLKEKEMA